MYIEENDNGKNICYKSNADISQQIRDSQEGSNVRKEKKNKNGSKKN